MRRRASILALVACAVGLVGFVAWSAWSRRGAEPAPVQPGPHWSDAQGAQTAGSASLPIIAADHAPSRSPQGTAPDAARGSLPTAPETLPITADLDAAGLLVRVVDDRGNPVAGIPVELNARVLGMGDDGRGNATTRAPDGLARIDLADLEELRPAAASIQIELRVVAEVASATPVETALDAWPTDGTEVELRLPPMGKVRVRVLDRDGEPLDAPASVGWWWLPADVVAADPSSAYERVPRHLADTVDGVAVIEHVGLGLALSLLASRQGFDGASERGVPGPREPGETKEIELRLGAPHATVRFRVLDVEGRPLPNARLHAELWNDPNRVPAPHAGPMRPSWSIVETDDLGVARFTRSAGTVDGAPRLDLSRRARDVEIARDPNWSAASLSLPQKLAEGAVVDLGDVRLAPVPTLAEGRVVDESGAPIPRASLTFRERYGPEHSWTNLDDGRIATGPGGEFTLRGVRTPRELAVYVHAKGFRPLMDHVLAPGERGIELVLAPASDAPPRGAIEVHVELDRDVSPMALLLEVRRPEGGGRTPDWWSGRAMKVDHLAPGRYDVWVETREGGLELARVEGIDVVAGEVARDPRLSPFDLRGLARTVELEVVRPDGTPWRRRELMIDPFEPRSTIRGKTDDRGRVALVLPRRITRLAVALDRDHVTQIGLTTSDEPARVVIAGE